MFVGLHHRRQMGIAFLVETLYSLSFVNLEHGDRVAQSVDREEVFSPYEHTVLRVERVNTSLTTTLVSCRVAACVFECSIALDRRDDDLVHVLPLIRIV